MTSSPRRFTVGRLLVMAAALAVFLGAGLYDRTSTDGDQAMIGVGIREITWGDTPARRRAAETLGNARPTDYTRVFMALVGATLGDPDAAVRRAAVGSLGLVLLNANPWGPSHRVVGETKADAAIVRVIVQAMGDAEPGVRRGAVESFSRLQTSVWIEPPLVRAAVPVFERLLGDADPATRQAATWCLGRTTTLPGEARNRVLAVAERDPDANVRTAAIQALVGGWPSVELYPILLDRRRFGRTAQERATACWSLANLPPPPSELIPTLVALMESDEVGALIVPQVLTKIAPDSRARLLLDTLRPVVWREIARSDSPLRAASLVAMIAPDSPDAQAMLEPLGRRLRESTNSAERHVTARVLAAYRESAAVLVPSLRALLRSGNADNRHYAAQLLGEIGRPALVALGDLRALQRIDDDTSLDTTLRKLQQLRPR